MASLADLGKYAKGQYGTHLYEKAQTMDAQQFEAYLNTDAGKQVKQFVEPEYIDKLSNALNYQETPEGKVETLGERYWERHRGIGTKKEKERATNFMRDKLTPFKHKGKDLGYVGFEPGPGLTKEETEMAITQDYFNNPEDYKEKYGITDYDKLKEIINEGYDIAKGTIQVDPDVGIMQASMLPSFQDLKTAWGKFTEAGDENLSDFDITSTMGVGTPKVPSGLSTDVYESKAPIAYEEFAPDKKFQAYEEFEPSLNRWGIANLIDQAEEEKRDYPVDEYMSPLKSFGESKTLAEYFKGRDISPSGIGQGVLQAYQLAKKSVPASWIYGAAQNLIPDFRGGQTQRDYNINRNLNINQSRVGMRSDPRTLRNLQINYARQGLNQDQIDRKIQNFQTVTGQIAGGAGAIAEGREKTRANQLAAEVSAATAKRDIQQYTGGHGSISESRDTGRQHTGHGKSGMGRSADRFAARGGLMLADGGRVRFSGGGIVGLWRELSNL